MYLAVGFTCFCYMHIGKKRNLDLRKAMAVAFLSGFGCQQTTMSFSTL